ncbi:GNAT family N-acetyltransferase [Exiguobacterium sp. AM39-5BH]|uniref:GNAT family N-acetyltransferase n=1 Tax=Exiguobacterium sp. AM39-5BH TaxID=2292355 RepID=UPI000FE194E7|nr:GNAT family N-acetyltransferase [Exiguobacterium sp. AM39-5BH]RHB48488.1 N-acetyltransferase [Exiguobacterium sp. AM39-5BH]
MNFRPLEQEDVKPLQRLFMESLSDLIHREQFEDADLLDEEVERLNTTVQDSFEDRTVQIFVVVSDDHIVGTAAILPPNDIITAHIDIETGVPEVGCMYVAPASQRQGVGHFLIANIRQQLMANGQSAFYLDAGFPTSQTYWEKRLGPPMMTIEHYWGPGAHHKIWRCSAIEKET